MDPVIQGELLRDESIELVNRKCGSFADRAAEVVRRRLSGQECLAEEFRRVCREEGATPRHHNGWGGLTYALVRSGTIVDTGRRAKSTDPRSHARRQPIWRVRG